MLFKVASQVTYAVTGPSTLILNVHAMRNGTQRICDEVFAVAPKTDCEEFVADQGQSRFVRMKAGPTKELKVTYQATVESKVRLIPVGKMSVVSVANFDRSVIPFIYPSRYCQSDKLGRLAFSKFGNIKHPFHKVTAISNWIYENVQYLSGSTNWQTSAFDTVTERAGVCRDFAHLGIALCRALNIPARYFSGYAYHLNPQDFHACFEAYIGGCWLLFDPTRLAPLNGLVRIATGRDAADAAIATIFGPTTSMSLQVSCEAVGVGFKPLLTSELSKNGVCFDAP